MQAGLQPRFTATAAGIIMRHQETAEPRQPAYYRWRNWPDEMFDLKL